MSLRKAVNDKCRSCLVDPDDAHHWRIQVEGCELTDCALWKVRPKSIVNTRFNMKNRMPLWADRAEIKRIYRERPRGFEVDHVIPLVGEIDGRPVCGLHVHYNLQYLTKSKNRAKRNRISEAEIPNE